MPDVLVICARHVMLKEDPIESLFKNKAFNNISIHCYYFIPIAHTTIIWK